MPVQIVLISILLIALVGLSVWMFADLEVRLKVLSLFELTIKGRKP